MNKNQLKNEKRVFYTLFLYLLLFIIACDFKKPEEWETPGLYTSLTIALVNNEYSYEGLVNDSTILTDSISNVIRVEYPVILPPQQIPDSLFDIDMSLVTVDIPDLGLGDSILIPPIPNMILNESIPFNNFMFDPNIECFPELIAQNISFPIIEQNISTDAFPIGNEFIEIRKIFLNQGIWDVAVENNLPFPVNVTFSIKNGNNSILNTGTALNNIINGTPKDTSIINTPEEINLKKDLIFKIETSIPQTDDQCLSEGIMVDGWEVTGGVTENLSLMFSYKFGLIDSVLVFTSGINQKIDIENEVPGYENMAIIKAKLASSKPDYPNQIFLEINNNFFLPIDLILIFNNFYDSVGVNSWSKLSQPIEVQKYETKIDTIDFSGFTLSKTDPHQSYQPINSIALEFLLEIGSGEFIIPVINIDNKSYLVETGPKYSLEITNMSLEYIETITHNMEFAAPSSPPIEGIPAGFTDIQFVDINLGMDLSNEIGIPLKMKLNVKGTRGIDTKMIGIDTLNVNYPFSPSNHLTPNCNFEPSNDTTRTVILLTQDSLNTQYYCKPSNTYPSNTINALLDNDQSSLVELINIVPERINIDGEILIDGVGRLNKGSSIWGSFTVISPLSFIFKKPIIIIPEDVTSLAPMDKSDAEKIKEAHIESAIYIKITNKSPLGGDLSLLISDSTIFPLSIDSLVTGKWSSQNNTIDTQIWDTLSIGVPDSIFVIPLVENIEKALEVQFFHYEIPETIKYFIGRMFDELAFPATDSIEYQTGYIIPPSLEEHDNIIEMNNTRMKWVTTDSPRFIVPLLTLQGSPVHSIIHDDTTFVPFTLQTTNAIDVQALLTISVDTEGFRK